MPTGPDALSKIREYIEKVSSADIVILPEIFNAPYSNEGFRQYAEPAGGKTYNFLSAVAKEFGVYLVGGSIPERDGEKIYNTAFVFSPEGKEVARHRKAHLFDIDVIGGQKFRESDTLTPGDEVTVFDTPFGKVGLCICFDIRFAEFSLAMAKKGADIIIVPAAFNMTTGPLHWELLFRARAVDNQVFTVGVAPARDESADYISYGNSIVVSPMGQIIERFDEKAQAKIVEIELSQVESVRTQIPTLSARREALYK
ncbi:MAG: carbon-nitrogen hydrolase family protein [Clostridia bacterium]|nr:carbon-nitrogen hydrolase family protein [Clostridia bacterium]